MPITQDRLQSIIALARRRITAEKSLRDQVQILREKYFVEDSKGRENLFIIVCNLVDDYTELDQDDYFILREEELHFKFYRKKNKYNAEYVRRHRAKKRDQVDSQYEMKEFREEEEIVRKMFENPEPEPEPVSFEDESEAEPKSEPKTVDLGERGTVVLDTERPSYREGSGGLGLRGGAGSKPQGRL